ncbi:hypothetical protein FRC09_008742 [Ceratobasidium sp. 395]|nr:hypothetical protein FRC09_008742 [Ceratobasidium sp. 395]
MKSWVANILVPYFNAQRERHGLPQSQRCILQTDCWSVHRSKKLLKWMEENYPWIDIKFVPAGCTGLFQACDVGIQGVLKIAIRNAAHADIVAEAVRALQSGTKPECVVNNQRLATLRSRSVQWLVQGYHAINNRSLVQKAFALCAVPGTSFNLSYRSLNSHDARKALNDLFATDPKLYAEIVSNASASDSLPLHSAAEEPLFNDSGDSDDTNPTAEEAVSHVLGARDAQEAGTSAQDVMDTEAEDYSYDF